MHAIEILMKLKKNGLTLGLKPDGSLKYEYDDAIFDDANANHFYGLIDAHEDEIITELQNRSSLSERLVVAKELVEHFIGRSITIGVKLVGFAEFRTLAEWNGMRVELDKPQGSYEFGETVIIDGFIQGFTVDSEHPFTIDVKVETRTRLG